MHKFWRLVINVDVRLLPQNLMIPLSIGLHNGVHLLIIGGLSMESMKKCFTMIGR